MCHRCPRVTGGRAGQPPSTARSGRPGPGAQGRARTPEARSRGSWGALRGSPTRRRPRRRPKTLVRPLPTPWFGGRATPATGRRGRQVTCALLGAPEGASRPEGGPPVILSPRVKQTQTRPRPGPDQAPRWRGSGGDVPMEALGELRARPGAAGPAQRAESSPGARPSAAGSPARRSRGAYLAGAPAPTPSPRAGRARKAPGRARTRAPAPQR